MSTYPHESFTRDFEGESPSKNGSRCLSRSDIEMLSDAATVVNEVDKQNHPGGRPGSQAALKVKAVDDVYANGKPYKGSDKLAGKVSLITV